MEQSTNGSNDPTRLDRIERIIEVLANTQVDLQQDVKVLLRGQIALGEHQVVLGDQMKEGFEKLAVGMERLTLRMDQLAAAQTHTDQRMDALILVVDELVRGRKQS
jgi:hypothetical protein